MIGVSVKKKDAEKAIMVLREAGKIEDNYMITSDTENVYIPLSSLESVDKILGSAGISFSVIDRSFPEREARWKDKMFRELGEKGLRVWSSYQQIGDLVVINIKSEDDLEDAKIFAEHLLKYMPRFRAVYAKMGTIGIYRVPRLIHLAGEKKTQTVVKEYGVSLAVDIARAYYNPSLAEEHHRIAEMIAHGEKILDLFSGIGGFTLHIATNARTIIIANDINPYAVRLMLRSLWLNRRKTKSTIIVCREDANKVLKALKNKFLFDRIIMNNPTRADDYISGALEVLAKNGLIHLYRLIDPVDIEEYVEDFLAGKGLRILGRPRRVIDYSPKRAIYRFDLTMDKT